MAFGKQGGNAKSPDSSKTIKQGAGGGSPVEAPQTGQVVFGKNYGGTRNNDSKKAK